MAKLQINTAETSDMPRQPGQVASQPVTDAGAQSLKLTCHSLSREGRWSVSSEPVSHVFYVWSGAVEVGGRRLGEGSAVTAELGADLELVALENTRLLDFHERAPGASGKSGGHVHVLPREELRGGDDELDLGRHSLYFDAECSDCDVWLHESLFKPSREIMRHYHTEDEIIFLISGEMHLGRQVLQPGTALAIAANTPYKFQAGPEGVGFVNFRPRSPTIVLFFDGMESEVFDEARVFKDIAANA